MVSPVKRIPSNRSGSSSDYGVNKGMGETTVAMLQENGYAFAMQEKENNKTGGGDTTSLGVVASLIPGCQTAEPMVPMIEMSPPLTAATAKARIKTLQAVAFIVAKRLATPMLFSPPPSGGGRDGGGGSCGDDKEDGGRQR